MKKIVGILLAALILVSCKKDNAEKVEIPTDTQENNKSISKMVSITNAQTVLLQNNIDSLKNSNARLSVDGTNNFIRTNIESYCKALIDAHPDDLVRENFEVNTIDNDNWDGQPNVFEGDATSLMPANFITKMDSLAADLQIVENNPLYDTADNKLLAAAEIENILQKHIGLTLADKSLHPIDQQGIVDGLIAAKQMVLPSMNYLNTLVTGAEQLGEDLSNWRRRTFFGKLIRAVVRVAIAVVAVTIATAILIKGGALIAPFSKFGLKVKAKGFAKSVFKGVTKKVKAKSVIGSPQLPPITGWLVTPSSLVFGSITGVIKGVIKWDTDMSLNKWYKEFDFKTKAKL